jgi:hypothetical protein
MEPLEGSKNYLVLGVVEADPIVADVVDRDIILVLNDAEFDPSVIAGSGILPCVLEQVGQENPPKRLVPEGLDFRLCLEPYVTIRDQHTQIVDDPSGQQRQVDFPSSDLDSVYVSEVAKVVDDMHHVPARVENTL